ncbi:MAG: hypothetical protein U0T36_12265 [Saprospiraceae bacterium]
MTHLLGQQATLAAKGNWDELKTLQDKLNGEKNNLVLSINKKGT